MILIISVVSVICKYCGTKNYWVFQPVFGYFKMVANTSEVTAWKWKGLFDESMKPPFMSNNNLNAGIPFFENARVLAKFNGNCLKQEKVIFTYKK